MPAKSRVRQIFSAADLAQARAIRRQVFVAEQGIPATTEEDGLNEQAIHVLLTVQEQVVGTARMYISAASEGEIARVAILPQFRGQGRGRMLVEELEAIARGLGLKRILLHPHHYLENFYAELGFRLVHGETNLAGEHLLITMDKILS